MAFMIVRSIGDTEHPIHSPARNVRRIERSNSIAEPLEASDAMSNLVYGQHLLR